MEFADKYYTKMIVKVGNSQQEVYTKNYVREDNDQKLDDILDIHVEDMTGPSSFIVLQNAQR